MKYLSIKSSVLYTPPHRSGLNFESLHLETGFLPLSVCLFDPFGCPVLRRESEGPSSVERLCLIMEAQSVFIGCHSLPKGPAAFCILLALAARPAPLRMVWDS